MIPLCVPASDWTLTVRTEVEDRGDVYSAYVSSGTAVVTAYPKAVTSARTEDGIVTDRRMTAFVTGRSDVSVGDRLTDADGGAWQVVSALPTSTGCELEIARLP